jgi:hypothetical protein
LVFYPGLLRAEQNQNKNKQTSRQGKEKGKNEFGGAQ